MAIRWGIGAYFAFFIIQVDSHLSLTVSPSASLSSQNSSNSALTTTTLQPTTKPCISRNFSVCWLNSPPYLIKNEKTGQITGMFHEVIEDLLSKTSKCRHKSEECSRLNYTRQVKNASELTECMESGLDFVFPVLHSQVKDDNYYQTRFQDLIRSPGIAVVKNRKVLERRAKMNVIHEFSQIWTVLVLALLLNAIFGILIWALDSRSNAEEFPRSFFRGSLEGIWWAFVTMTTVGYGDKAPKFLLTRVLSVVWMFIGVGVMAYLTAIMTTALTSGTVTNHMMIVNKEFGVVANSQGYTEGKKQGARVKEYNDFEALRRALINEDVEGILLDVFTTSYIFNNKDTETDMLEQVRVLEFPFLIGLYMVQAYQNNDLLKYCFKSESEKSETNIYPTLLKYLQGPTVGAESEVKESWKTNFNLFSSSEPAFHFTLYTLSSVLAALVVLSLMWELVTRQKRQTFKLDERGNRRRANTDVPLVRKDFKRMLEHISELENSLAKISEMKEAYYKMEDYWSYRESQKATREVTH